jgi:hypothetical protein
VVVRDQDERFELALEANAVGERPYVVPEV